MNFFFALFLVLAIMAIIYLFLGGMGLNDALPKNISSVLIRLAVTIILTAIPLGIYDMTGIGYFSIIAAAVFAFGLFFILKDPFYDKAKRAYRKKFGKGVPEGEWICKSCGEVNIKINRVCRRCGAINPE